MVKGFLNIEGIDGEGTDDKDEEWIEILSYSHGITQTSNMHSGAGGVAGKGELDDFWIMFIFS